MPIYQYKCEKKNCSHEFELFMRHNEVDPPCPKCKAKVQKLMSSSSLKFIGAGFYTTDYGSSK